MADVRVSQVATEALTPQAAATSERVSQVVAEALTPQAAATSFRASQVVVETLSPNTVDSTQTLTATLTLTATVRRAAAALRRAVVTTTASLRAVVATTTWLRAAQSIAASLSASPVTSVTLHASQSLLSSLSTIITTGPGQPAIAVLPVPAQDVPTIPCAPEGHIFNGGLGNAGCNTGGIGWESSYNGAYGAVPQHPDPVNGETLTGKNSVDIWVEILHTDYPSGLQTTYRRSLSELPDLPSYRGGRKAAGLLSVGDVEHGLSNEQGSFEAATVDLEFSDAPDRFWRTLLETQDLEGDEVTVCLASKAARDAGVPPRIIMRGVVQQSPTQSSLVLRLTAVDVLFAEGGPFGPQRQWPPLIPSDVFTNAPPESLELTLPVIYGEKSDEGAKDPVTNDPNPKGVVPLIYVGRQTIDGSQAPGTFEQDLSIPRPEVATMSNLLPAPGQDGFHDTVYIWFAAQRVSDGKIGPFALNPHTGIEQVTALNPAGEEHEEGTWAFIHFMFIDDEPDPAYRYIGFASTDPAYHPLTNPGPVGDFQYGVASHDGVTADSFYERDDGRDASLLVKPIATMPINEWDAYLVCLGASYQILSLYGSDLGAGGDDAEHSRVQIDVNARGGSDILGPDWPNWPLPNRYVSYTGADGTEWWFTMIFARGELSEDHKKGVVNMTVNIIGREDVGDGTGLPLMTAHAVEQHWYENEVLREYTSGLWVTNDTAPRFSEGTYKVRSSSFTAAQGFSERLVGGDGLLVGWYVGEDRALTDWVAEWDRATETRTGINGFGQIVKFYIDDTLDITNWPRLEHVTSVYGPILRLPGIERENVVVGTCDYDPDAEKFRIVPLKFSSPAGILKYKNRKKQGDPIESPILNREAHLSAVLQRRLARLKFGETVADISGSLGFLDYDVGEGIRLTSFEGVGGNGDVDRPYVIMRRRTNLANRTVTYTLLDVYNTIVPLENQFIVGTEGSGTAQLVGLEADENGFLIGP